MANEQGPQVIVTRKSDADYSASQYHFVKVSGGGANTITIATAQGEDCLGILQNRPDAANKPAEVLMFGISKLKMNDAVEDGGPICTETDGKGDIATTADYVLARSIHGSTSVDGDIITVAVNTMASYIY